MYEYPDKTILNSETDTSLYGFYASLGAGGFLLAYAIYYVTIVNVTSDYAYLTLGIVTGATAISCIIFHEWLNRTKGQSRNENAIEEYSAATAVLMGSLSVIWLSRFLVFFMGIENEWIEIQDSEIWIPVWLSLLQTISIIIVMEISIKMINRHSLGTLPRTIVILAPISLAFSAISIWMDYSNGILDIFLTSSFILLMTSSILASLRLNRSALYLLSSGLAVVLPLLLGIYNFEHLSLLVPFVIIIGITATDKGLSQQMIERGSGVVVSAILFAQIIAAGNQTSYVFVGLIDSPDPFGLTFWLWVSLLIGWFAPTAMLRTPAMPIGLALSLTLLSAEASLIGWFIGFLAFIYLETREQARDWVVKATYFAMIIAWLISSVIGVENEIDLINIGDFTLDSTTASSLILFPLILALGYWGQSRGRFGDIFGPSLVILAASLNIVLLSESSILFSLIIVLSSITTFYKYISSEQRSFDALLDRNVYASYVLLPIIFVSLQVIGTFELISIDLFSIIFALIIYTICHIYRKNSENLILRSEFTFVIILIFIALVANIPEESGKIIQLILIILAILVTLIAIESGAIRSSTPVERLIGIIFLLPIAAISSAILLAENGSIYTLILHDLIILSAPFIVNMRLKKLHDLSQEARNYGSLTLISLVLIGLTDISGGLLAIPVYSLVVYRATKHVSTPLLLILPLVSVGYATIFGSNYSDNSILWPLLESIPYLGQNSELFILTTPRWSSLLLLFLPLMVSVNIPIENRRPEGSRYGPEQFFGPLIAVLLGISFLLPDEKLAPIFIISLLTYGSWKYGLGHWFWITPIGAYWAILNLTQLMNLGDNYHTGYATFVAGLTGLTQYFLIRNGFLYTNFKDNFSIDQLEYLAPVSRILGYSFLLLSDDISNFIPFFTSLLIAFDTFHNNRIWLFHSSILLQTFTLYSLLDGQVEFGYVSLWPSFIGIYMIYCSWTEYNPFPIDEKSSESVINVDYQYNLGLIGSLFTILFMMSFAEEIGLYYLFEIVLIIIAAHHMILGFKRDQGWRRLFGLIGLPIGLISLGSQFDGLILVLMLFLAALTLIGQAVLYSSKGGLGLGSTIEGAEPILSNVGLPEKTENRQNKNEISTNLNEPTNNLTIDESKENMAINISPSPIFTSDKSNFKIKLDSLLLEKMDINIEDAYKSFDSSLWSPILRINPDGKLLLEWERI